MRIVIDPGHSSRISGAKGEAELNLAYALTLKHLIYSTGHEVHLTHTGDGLSADLEKDLRLRVAFARAKKADVFLSVHMNAATPQARGFEAIYADGDERSKLLAGDICRSLYNHTMSINGGSPALPNRGAKPMSATPHRYLYVLGKQANIRKAVLVEFGFVSNPRDLALLNNLEFRIDQCSGVVEAVLKG